MNRFDPLPDEHVIIENPKHWRNYILPVGCIALCLGGMALRLAYPEANLVNWFTKADVIPEDIVNILSYVEAFVMLITMTVLFISVIDIAYTRYYVTNKRIISSAGWLNVRIADMLLERCETVSLFQRVSERLFNSGDILCASAGTSIYLDDVYDARRFRQTIMRMMTAKKEEDNNDRD